MRRITFAWTFLVLALVLTIYGGYSLIYSLAHNEDVPILGLVFLIVGTILLVLFAVLMLITYFQKKKHTSEHKEEVVVEEAKKVEEVVEKKEEPKPEKKTVQSVRNYSYDEDDYPRAKSYSRYDSETIYVKKVGYGPVLRIEGANIFDMRSNTYYRIEGNMIHQNGYGPVYEISGNRIRIAFSSYIFELSGDNINKVFGGYYASFNGTYLQTFDLKEKYEITGRLNNKQKLAIAALLFNS